MTARGIGAALLALAISAIVVWPFCDALFDCGCTWPWAGGSAHCNIHDPKAKHHCPWCTYPLASNVSLAAGAVAAALVSLTGDSRSRSRPAAPRRVQKVERDPRPAALDFSVRALAGAGAFLVVSGIGAGIIALTAQ